MVFWILVALVLGMLAYIRLAPVDVTRWHQPVVAQADKDFAGGAIRVVHADAGTLARLDTAARALPRTTVVAGSVEEGRVTYVTRSAVIGFPDFTTIEQHGDSVRLHGRLRFGIRDFGVNRARLRQLIGALK